MSDQIGQWLREYQLALMEEASESEWCAGWMMGLEEMMWNGSMADHPTAVKVRQIARVTGIWWMFNKASHKDPDKDWRRAVPIEKWRESYGPEPEYRQAKEASNG